MKILAICGSPRKGNTFSVLNSIREEFPDIDYEILMLKDMELKDCYGCYACINRGPEICPLKDDRDLILKKMEEADGVVFATPTNTRHVTALMKKFMDKLGYIAHRPYFFDKYALFVSTCKGFGADLANEYMSSNIGQYGFNVVSSLDLYVSTKSGLILIDRSSTMIRISISCSPATICLLELTVEPNKTIALR